MHAATINSAEIFGDPIHTYTRAQAIEDGVLVDVSEAARDAGILWPVAATAAVWADCVAWSDADEQRKRDYTGQSESGRLWDLCWMLSLSMQSAARRGLDARKPLSFELARVPREGRGVRPRAVRLLFIVGPGDAGEPVITILQPNED